MLLPGRLTSEIFNKVTSISSVRRQSYAMGDVKRASDPFDANVDRVLRVRMNMKKWLAVPFASYKYILIAVSFHAPARACVRALILRIQSIIYRRDRDKTD